MNCEKCKNRRASVFYADEDGGRHALCAACATLLGKSPNYSPANNDITIDFTPPILLMELSPSEFDKKTPVYCNNDGEELNIQCHACGTSIVSALKDGTVGCPLCYTAFGELLFPCILSPDRATGARMPLLHKTEIDRRRAISEMKQKIKLAIELENYELAAELRDKIKSLEK